MPHCRRPAAPLALLNHLLRPLRVHGLCGLVLVFAITAARADDRPFLQTSNAVAEDDDEGTWALESWWARVGSHRMFNFAPEYAFSPFTNLQFKAFGSRDRDGNGGSGSRASGVETEFKHLFNHIARDGFGWGLHLSLAVDKGNGNGSSHSLREQSVAAKLITTLPLQDGDAKLHANAGLGKQRDERREWIGSVAYEHKLPWRSTAFVELGREDRETLAHAGVRHWVRRERLAVDVSVQQQRAGAERAHGIVIGIGWYDL